VTLDELGDGLKDRGEGTALDRRWRHVVGSRASAHRSGDRVDVDVRKVSAEGFLMLISNQAESGK
jgi:hypothetical protein